MMGWLMRLAVAGLHLLAVGAAASAVMVGVWSSHTLPVVLPAAQQPAETERLRERIEEIGREQAARTTRIGRLEDFERRTVAEHGKLTVLLVGNLAAVIASLVTYIVLERRRSGPR